jgi:hypothetical protein
MNSPDDERDGRKPKPDAMPVTAVVGSATAAALTVAILAALWSNEKASPAPGQPLSMVFPWWAALALQADHPPDRRGP